MERLEAEPDHEVARNRDRRSESRRPLDEGAKAERDQQQLQPAVGGDPRHRLLHDLELAGKHRDVAWIVLAAVYLYDISVFTDSFMISNWPVNTEMSYR